MGTLRNIALTCTLTGLTGGLVYLSTTGPAVKHGPDQPVTQTASRAMVTAESILWAPRTTYRFRLTHESESHVKMTPEQTQPFSGRARWAGDLHLTPTEDGEALLARLTDVRVAQFDVLGQPNPLALVELEGLTARIELTEGGGLGDLRIRSGTPEMPARIFSEALAQLRFEVEAGADGWVSNHGDALGEGEVHYAVDQSNGPWSAKRTRASYDAISALPHLTSETPRVEGEGRVLTTADGALERITESRGLVIVDGHDQSLVEMHVSVGLQRLGSRTAEAVIAEDDTHWVDLSDLAHRRQLDADLKARVGDMTLEKALDALATRAGRTLLPDHSEWLWRVTGLLTLHPELCAAFAEGALQHGYDPQRLALDLLASTGHASAQDAMLKMFDASSIDDGTQRHRMVHSLLLVEQPTEATVSFARQRYAEGAVDALAAANAMGSMAGELASMGRDTEATSLVQQLSEGLAAADSDHARKAHVVALGNSGHPKALETLVEATHDEATTVRRAAARALRHQDNDSAADALVRLTLDDDAEVQAQAVASLIHMGVSPGDLDPLGDQVRDSGLSPQVARAVLEAAERHRLPEAEAEEWMETVAGSDLPRRYIERALKVQAAVRGREAM
ncbi:MAG: HEAT repeat domain-containing protein [Bradymonadia bacterium]